MAFNLPPLWFTQLFDNFGAVLAGGQVETYVTGTTTPKATYTDATGATPNANPIILDSAGRADIWLADDALYRLVIKTAAGVTLETVDGVGEVAIEAEATAYDVWYSRAADGLVANEYLFVMPFVRSITFPANFAGSRGRVEGNNPAATYTVALTRNGFSCGTVTISTAGAFTFASASGLPVTCVAGDRIVARGAATPDVSLSDWSFCLKGDRA